MKGAISHAGETGTTAQMEANGIPKKIRDEPWTAESCKATYVETTCRHCPAEADDHLAYLLTDEQYDVTTARQNGMGHHDFSSWDL